MKIFNKQWQAAMTIAFVSLGLLLSIQFRTYRAMAEDLNSQSSETLATIAKNLTTKYYELIREVWDLRSQLKLLDQSANQNRTIAEAVKMEQQKLNIAIGSKALSGPGLIITIPPNDQNYFGYQDLIDIVNELWNAGAEAVSVNGYRINEVTSITPGDDFTTIVLNGDKLSYPYTIKAIGEPATLEKGISIPSGIIDNLRAVYKIPLEIQQEDKLKLPAGSKIKFQYAKPIQD